MRMQKIIRSLRHGVRENEASGHILRGVPPPCIPSKYLHELTYLTQTSALVMHFADMINIQLVFFIWLLTG